MQLVSDIDYNYSKCKPWIELEKGFFSGSVFLGKKMLNQEDIRSIASSIITIEDAMRLIRSLNGHFAMALAIGDSIFLAVDRLRTIPLFYEMNGEEVCVKNRILLDDITSHGINETAFKELDYSLFVTGNNTIACNIYSVMAGECIVITNGKINRKFYHELKTDSKVYNNDKNIFVLMNQLFGEVTQRLITYLNGRTAIIPLSGGHDSRLIVYYLKKYGYKDIISYTYGPEGNSESETSQKVAKYLGIKWYNIIYRPQLLQKFFKTKFENITDFCFNGVSSVCVQDWYAVDYLKQQGVVPKDAVFVPGHSFDFLAGGHILPKYIEKSSITQEQLIKDIVWKHFSEGVRELPQDQYDYYKRYILNEYLKGYPQILNNRDACCIYHNFDLRERQSKFICNQVRIYEYYGYDWFLPLWDSKLTDFWMSIDIELRYNRKIFFDFTNHEYRDLMLEAPVENEKIKSVHKVKMNPFARVCRKINQLVNYVDFHYCLAYFSRREVIMMFLPKKVLNIGYFVNYKIKKIIRRRIKNG